LTMEAKVLAKEGGEKSTWGQKGARMSGTDERTKIDTVKRNFQKKSWVRRGGKERSEIHTPFKPNQLLNARKH